MVRWCALLGPLVTAVVVLLLLLLAAPGRLDAQAEAAKSHGRPPCVGQDRKLPECQTPTSAPSVPSATLPPTTTASATATLTMTPAPAATSTAQPSATATSGLGVQEFPSLTPTPLPSATPPATATAVPSVTPLPSATSTATATRTPTPLPSTTATASATPTKALVTATATQPPAATIVGPEYDYTQQRYLLVDDVNATRAEQNDPAIQPLTVDQRIMRVAQWKAQDMNARHYTDHVIPAGACYTNTQGATTCWDHDIYVWDVLGAEGIGGLVGENVWLGPPLGDGEADWCAYVFWQHPGHHEAMVDPTWHYIGTGMAYYTWTQGVTCEVVFAQFNS